MLDFLLSSLAILLALLVILLNIASLPGTAAMLGADHLLAALLGAFLFALVAELIQRKPFSAAAKAALGAALGRGTGIIIKLIAGFLTWLILLLAWLIPTIFS